MIKLFFKHHLIEMALNKIFSGFNVNFIKAGKPVSSIIVSDAFGICTYYNPITQDLLDKDMLHISAKEYKTQFFDEDMFNEHIKMYNTHEFDYTVPSPNCIHVFVQTSSTIFRNDITQINY